ncbi:MAG: LysR family transcriptional regulator [Betaproteobacteria bacterium]|nr:LysR family transcriptional regulator [Betaproteobacteria bacterium]
MELYQLRAFATVAETGQLTRAARRLHLSQPALSAQIKALEEELGQVLFERTPGGMTLTPAGRGLQDSIGQVLAAADTLKARAQALRHDVVARLRIGTVSDPDFIRVGPLLNIAVARFPHLEIELHNVFSGAALDQVQSGALDASFYFGAIAHANVKGLALREMVYRIAAPADWAERIRGADWPAIAAMPWILTPPTSTHHALVEAMLGEHGLSATKQAEADNESVIANLVRAGVGLSLLREELALAMQEEGQVVIWAPAGLVTKLWFIYSTDRVRDPAIAAVLKLLRELWRLPADDSDVKLLVGAPAAAMP